MASFRTVDRPGEHAFERRKSQFLGRIEPARTVPAAEQAIDAVRAAHPDASHVVAAYRIRADPLREWSNDDGEPRGSAGPPVLSVIEGQSLENVVVTVVRYYGGTNLGIGGLVRSYTDATTGAIAATTIVERVPHQPVTITVTYDDSGTVRSILESEGLAFDAAYEASVTFDAVVPTAEYDDLRDRILSATSGRANLEG